MIGTDLSVKLGGILDLTDFWWMILPQ
jgi:hypothetical protein